MAKALLVVDAQLDFMPGGSLVVPGGNEIIPFVNTARLGFDHVIFSKDEHPEDHCSFKEKGGPWPKHCVIGSPGACLHQDLMISKNDIFISKGIHQDVDSYSAFWDNEKKHNTKLKVTLSDRNVTLLFVCGLATDVCVKHTVLDAIHEGFKVILVKPACRAVNINPGDEENAINEMVNAGAGVVW